MTQAAHPYRPKRHLRNEIYSLALVMAAPIGVIAVFPFASLSFSPSPHAIQDGAKRPACSFVSLTDEQADAAVQAARSAIKTAHEGISALRADLSISAIPSERGGVADVSERQGAAPVDDAQFKVLILPPSLAAPPPAHIAPDPSATNYPAAFSRDQMLEIFD